MPEVGPKRPYLLRAMHEWMSDNQLTPHIVVDATFPGVNVPQQYVADGKIVLNVGYAATRDLVLGAESLTFRTRFGGVGHAVDIPVAAVLGIYAQETGQGMIFTEEETPTPDEGEKPAKGRPDLKIIK
ncbi:MAG TPA: ClpXP protease specificity-enhancing factor [Gammaproteobacteria bacterium]|nr:ClpXP protease specificity-enhancing factor [Gammaproteobacteria bacterium]